ncbi:MAG: hypothetical protein IKR13_00415 [Victivallales bacterium]|nr:hypothetical protein [Victivallales bacterium]
MPEIIEATNFHFATTHAVLARHNARWEALLRNWHERGGGIWMPGMIVSLEIRGRIETFLPWREFARSLRNVARIFLPSEAWVPRLLQDGILESILEFWEELSGYSGRVSFQEGELEALFCTCADPPRFGTDVGRYPQQVDLLRRMKLPSGGRLLDLGCGVGLGTLEAVAALGLAGGVGVTQEPLEAWMAKSRRLPHDPVRSRHFSQFADVSAQFAAGDVLEWCGEGGFAVILCNGLAGGRFLSQDEQLRKLLKVFEAQLAPGGVVGMANAFHEGQRSAVERLLALAQEEGWQVVGTWQNAVMTR